MRDIIPNLVNRGGIILITLSVNEPLYGIIRSVIERGMSAM